MWVEKIDETAITLTQELLVRAPHTRPIITAVLWSAGQRLALASTPGSPGLSLPTTDKLPAINDTDPGYAREYLTHTLGGLVTSLGVTEADTHRTYGLLKPNIGQFGSHSLTGDDLQGVTEKIFAFAVVLRNNRQIRGHSWHGTEGARSQLPLGKSPAWQQAYKSIVSRAMFASRHWDNGHLQNGESPSYSNLPTQRSDTHGRRPKITG